jgi:hypothetical protein
VQELITVNYVNNRHIPGYVFLSLQNNSQTLVKNPQGTPFAARKMMRISITKTKDS